MDRCVHYLPLHAEFDPFLGVTATDSKDVDLASAVTWDIRAVDVTTPGTCPVTLMLHDSDVNYLEVICCVTVIDGSSPELQAVDHVADLNSDRDFPWLCLG